MGIDLSILFVTLQYETSEILLIPNSFQYGGTTSALTDNHKNHKMKQVTLFQNMTSKTPLSGDLEKLVEFMKTDEKLKFLT